MSTVGTPHKRGHARSRSSVAGEETPILQGWLARESGVVSALLNKRFGALYPTALVTYRKETDEASSGGMTPSKVWSLSRDVSLTPVDRHTFKLRHAKTSTLWAVTAKAYDAKDMWGFSVKWPNSGIIGQDHLVLAFEEEREAELWHRALSDVIARLPARTVSGVGDLHSRQASLTSEADAGEGSPPPSPMKSGLGAELGAERGAVATGAEGSAAAAALPATAVPMRHVRAASEDSTARPRPRSWASVMHINGVALFVEDSDADGSGGAIMVSAVVKAPPHDVFRHLVHNRKTEGKDIFSGVRVLEVIDATTQVVAQTWNASGIASSFLAPREIVLLRTFRRDEDGTYIVLYQSTRHRSVPESRSWGWNAPVRVGVQAAGFTVAPLLPKYHTEGESRECLLTMVLKADFGGVVSERSRLARLFGPLAGVGLRGLLEPVVSSVIVLRDKKRSASTLAYRREPLLLAQRAVAAEQLSRLSMLPPGAVPGALGSGPSVSGPSSTGAAAPAADAAPAAEAGDAAAAERVEEDAWAIGGTCPRQFWSCPGDAGFKVRGPSYLADKRKVPAGPPVFELVAVDLLELEEPMLHVARHLPSVRNAPAPFLFCVQMMVPCKPPVALVASWAAPVAVLDVAEADLVAAYEAHSGKLTPGDAAFLKALAAFINGEGPEADRARNKQFKLIPHISKGAWIMQKSVGTTPVILGQKLTTKYFKGSNYFEVDVDIGASSVAASITNMVVGATKSLTLDMGVLLEGQTPATLPEQLLGTIRLAALDMKTAAYFDEGAGRIIQPEQLK
ncbi:hypothetical protein F751_2859 [Auxenochlorella protothecoides]|uniref:START domain-containing protein n=1 Tax=Auxenochlorella protothecoides TaxID=3075 RepID=A0A087SCZ6_AUXPR|nr:hypothetical protein F751_2859 [Auxenochlorella protothecoides]KFM23600.1 hypothetical protein F751_2859 [Auxenochlorella protothecoides]